MAASNGARDVAARFKGLIAPIPTVFDGQGEVDVPAMQTLADWYLSKGVHGFFVLGSQGQGPACRTDQRKLVAETVVRQVDGRVPVVVQVGAVDPYTSVELAVHAKQVGADAVGVVGPYYYSDHNEWEFIEHHRLIDAAVNMPMFLYNNPEYSGYPTTPAMMNKLRQVVPGVFGAKLAAGNLEQGLRYMRELGEGFSIFIPINHVLPGMLVGIRGSIAAGAPVTVPELGVQLVEAIWAENFERARQIQLLLIEHSNRMAPLRKYGRATTLLGLQARGLPIKQYPRWPTMPVSPEDRKLMDENMKKILDGLAVPA